MKISLSSLFFLLFFCSCSKQENPEFSYENCVECESESDVTEVKNMVCRITTFNNEYVLIYDTAGFNKPDFDVWDKMLVPCGLPESRKVKETFITVNGKIIEDCCNLLSAPDIRRRFGCKFLITKIID